MTLRRWLHGLIAGKVSSVGQGETPGQQTLAEWHEPEQTVQQDQDETDDQHRIHIAANDPTFPAKREAAIAAICAAISDIACPLGYARTGHTWSRSSPRGKTFVSLQRSHYGWDACIHLRFLTPTGDDPPSDIWAQNDDIHLGQFYLPGEGSGSRTGALCYLDVSQNAAILDLPMAILRDRALPWLDAHHDGVPVLAADLQKVT